MIKNLNLKFGRAPKQDEEKITLSPVTIFVGPNNSGKTQILHEISRLCNQGEPDQEFKILDSFELEDSDDSKAAELIDGITLAPESHENVRPGNIVVGKFRSRNTLEKSELLSCALSPNKNPNAFCSFVLGNYTLFLDGISRINLTNERVGGDLQSDPKNSLQILFRDDEKRDQVRKIVYDSFGVYLVIDPTNLGHLRFRLSEIPPESEIQERGLYADSVSFHNAAQPILEAGDGVKAFVGIISEIIAGDPLVILIDEPEAFLHPALAFNLGKEIAKSSAEGGKNIFISTHSPHFLMGCIQSGRSVNIVRLTYRNKIATARCLKNTDLLQLMRKPLLRSTSVINGIFYEFVVVTEGDTDRCFYEEINERLLRLNPEWGIPNCLFLNAQNKQTVSILLTPLRNLGIPTAAIVDLDVLKEGKSVWSSFLMGGFLPELDQVTLAVSRGSLHKELEKNNGYGNGGGIEVLGVHREAAANLCDSLAEYGLFLVRDGELESWLPELDVQGHGPEWLTKIFEKMGEDPNDKSYLKPGNDGVWHFVNNVRNWLFNSNRKGIPT